ncbi:N-acetyltransferase [Paraburkholderia tropica]|nr:N-acetyltransferase [Paraburkholderia tropica]
MSPSGGNQRKNKQEKRLVADRTEILTARLRLRRARRNDAVALFENYTGNVDCSRFLQRLPHADVARTEAMIDNWCKQDWERPDTPFSWVISTREDDEAIGIFLAIPEGHKTEIHFGIGKRFWGRGFVAEAGAAALSSLWRAPHTQRIWTVCDVENTRSQRVLDKLGFQHEGMLRKWLRLPAFGEIARDCHVYASTAHRD